MSVARFIADQRTEHQVPHALSCRVLGVSASWFYKWLNRPPTARQTRQADLDAAVKKAFDASKGTYGSPRIHADLIDPPSPADPAQAPAPWRVSVNTVANSMRRQGGVGVRTEVLRSLLTTEATELTVSRLAELASYTKRIVAATGGTGLHGTGAGRLG